jgi:hypothetical protein
LFKMVHHQIVCFFEWTNCVLRAVGLLQSAKNTAELPERKK